MAFRYNMTIISTFYTIGAGQEKVSGLAASNLFYLSREWGFDPKI